MPVMIGLSVASARTCVTVPACAWSLAPQVNGLQLARNKYTAIGADPIARDSLQNQRFKRLHVRQNLLPNESLHISRIGIKLLLSKHLSKLRCF